MSKSTCLKALLCAMLFLMVGVSSSTFGSHGDDGRTATYENTEETENHDKGDSKAITFEDKLEHGTGHG